MSAPDEAHEAMRDLVRAREAAVKAITAVARELVGFMWAIVRMDPKEV